MDNDTNQTKKLPALCPHCFGRYTMRDDVYGHVCLAVVASTKRPRIGRWLWAGLILAASTWGLAGCAAHAQAPQIEAVGTLAVGPSVWHAPVMGGSR